MNFKYIIIMTLLSACSSDPIKNDLIQDNSSLEKEDVVPAQVKEFKVSKKRPVSFKNPTINLVKSTVPVIKKEARIKSIPFKENESTNLTIWYGSVKAGKISMQVLPDKEMDGVEVYHFKSKIETTSSIINAIFRINLTTESFVDKNSFSSVRYQVSGQEGNTIKNNIEFYDIKNKKTTIWYREEKSGKKTEDRRSFDNLPEFSQDILSAVFFSRTLDFSIIKKHSIPVVSKERNRLATLTLIGEESLKVKGRSVSCWIVSLKIDSTKEEDQKIWISKELDRNIYQLSVKSKVGELLGKIEN